MSDSRYQDNLKKKHEDYEGICKRCGACCGALDGDPCEKLIKNPDGTYLCSVYDTRIGQQKTASGKTFTCIPIKDVIRFTTAPPGCAYR